MADNDEELISGLVDGELRGGELARGLQLLRNDARLADRWGRYHLISDALHNNLPGRLDEALHRRVKSAVEQEPVVLAPGRWFTFSPGFAKQAVGFALAASVSAIAIVGVQSLNREPSGTTTTASTFPQSVQTNVASADGIGRAQPDGRQYIRMTGVANLDPQAEAVQRDLEPYLVNHNEYAIAAGMHGMLPYVRIVSDRGGR